MWRRTASRLLSVPAYTHPFGSGCFEEWLPALGNITTDTCQLTPAFAKETIDVNCCSLRPTTSVVVTAHQDTFDHATITSASTVTVPLSETAPTASISVHTLSFDNTTAGAYKLNLTWVPGDMHCEVGKKVGCYNASGVVQPCLSKTHYPVEELEGSMECLAGPPANPNCGYITFNFSQCVCPACRAGADYACVCDGRADGVQECDAHGQLKSCDCSKTWAYPPASPPPAPPPPSGGGSTGVVIGLVAACVVGIGGAGGGFVAYRRHRERRLQAAYSNLLLNPASEVDVPVNDATSYQQYDSSHTVQND